MNTLSTAQQSGTLPHERKNFPAQRPIINPDEQIEGIDRVGFFGEHPMGFNATGSIDFKPNILSDIFNKDSWVSIASKAVDTARDLAPDIADAGIDLFNQMTGKTEVPQAFHDAFKDENPSKLDPNIQPKNKSEDLKNYSIIKETQAVLEKAQADYRGKSMLDAALNPKRVEVADLANLQSGKDVLDNNGEIRTDLQSVVEQKRKEIIHAQQEANQNPVISTSKKGGQGANLDQNKITEGVSVLSSNNAQ